MNWVITCHKVESKETLCAYTHFNSYWEVLSSLSRLVKPSFCCSFRLSCSWLNETAFAASFISEQGAFLYLATGCFNLLFITTCTCYTIFWLIEKINKSKPFTVLLHNRHVVYMLQTAACVSHYRVSFLRSQYECQRDLINLFNLSVNFFFNAHSLFGDMILTCCMQQTLLTAFLDQPESETNWL